MNEFEKTTKDWEYEVEKVAANLVRQGTPPWKASIEAAKIVEETRRGRPRVRPLTIE